MDLTQALGVKNIFMDEEERSYSFQLHHVYCVLEQGAIDQMQSILETKQHGIFIWVGNGTVGRVRMEGAKGECEFIYVLGPIPKTHFVSTGTHVFSPLEKIS